MQLLKLNLIVLALLGLWGCTDIDDKEIVDNTSTSLRVQFDHHVNEQDLVLNTQNYQNSSQETYTVGELKYIISNIVLTHQGGAEFAYPKAISFFVIDANDPASLILDLDAIADGVYDKLQFGFGVDQSQYPLEGANFVPQADEKGMIWSWTTGFKFLKFEGTYVPEGTTAPANFVMHMGSDGINQDNYQTITLDLDTPLKITQGKSASLMLRANVAKILDGQTPISIAAKPNIQIDPINAPIIAQNCASIFSVAP